MSGGFNSYNSSSNNYSRSKNPFGDEDDDNNNSGFSFGNRSNKNDFNSNTATNKEKLQTLQERIGYVEDESLESTRRALRMINETHQVGAETAQELYRQGEKLQSMETKIDQVNDTLTATQKNLNQIKSIFGGFKNKFIGRSSSKDDFKKVEPKSTLPSSSSVSSSMSTTVKTQHAVITGSEREKELNSNLDEMSLGLGQLKSLALGMQLEIDRQDPMVERLSGKIDRTHIKVQDQNAQMKRILK
jgi:synaptosomal-associated protein 29